MDGAGFGRVPGHEREYAEVIDPGGPMFMCGHRAAEEFVLCIEPGCQHLSDLLCDYPMGRGKTCDLALCDDHAREIGEDRHLWSTQRGSADDPPHPPLRLRRAHVERAQARMQREDVACHLGDRPDARHAFATSVVGRGWDGEAGGKTMTNDEDSWTARNTLGAASEEDGGMADAEKLEELRKKALDGEMRRRDNACRRLKHLAEETRIAERECAAAECEIGRLQR